MILLPHMRCPLARLHGYDRRSVAVDRPNGAVAREALNNALGQFGLPAANLVACLECHAALKIDSTACAPEEMRSMLVACGI